MVFGSHSMNGACEADEGETERIQIECLKSRECTDLLVCEMVNGGDGNKNSPWIGEGFWNL